MQMPAPTPDQFYTLLGSRRMACSRLGTIYMVQYHAGGMLYSLMSKIPIWASNIIFVPRGPTLTYDADGFSSYIIMYFVASATASFRGLPSRDFLKYQFLYSDAF